MLTSQKTRKHYRLSMEEWISNKKSEPGKRAKAENRSRKEIPLFLALRSKLIE